MARRTILGLSVVLSTGISGSSHDWLATALNHFANRYNRFIEDLRAGQFDLRDAKALSKAWRDVETCGQWPKEKP
jgi:hypothetical protein